MSPGEDVGRRARGGGGDGQADDRDGHHDEHPTRPGGGRHRTPYGLRACRWSSTSTRAGLALHHRGGLVTAVSRSAPGAGPPLSAGAAAPGSGCRRAASCRRSSPWWRTTMRWAMSSPRPVPWSTGLVVKKASKTRAWSSAGIPGPSSPISTHTRSPCRARAQGDAAPAADRVDRVVDQVRPDLVQLGARRLDARQRRGRGRGRSRRCLARSLWARSDERALEPLVDVDRLARRLVEVRVAPDGADEARRCASSPPPARRARRARRRRPRRSAGRRRGPRRRRRRDAVDPLAPEPRLA